MITAADVWAGLAGAARLAAFDRRGFEYFDTSQAGFWKAFIAALATLPIFLLASGSPPEDIGATRYYLVQSIAYVFLLGGYPLAVMAITRTIDREYEFLTYMVAYYWAGVLFAPLVLLPGLFAPPASGYALSATYGLWGVYHWFVARGGLRIAAGAAVVIVVFDILFGFVVGGLAALFLPMGG